MTIKEKFRWLFRCSDTEKRLSKLEQQIELVEEDIIKVERNQGQNGSNKCISLEEW